jgi:hypothetical protein
MVNVRISAFRLNARIACKLLSLNTSDCHKTINYRINISVKISVDTAAFNLYNFALLADIIRNKLDDATITSPEVAQL